MYFTVKSTDIFYSVRETAHLLKLVDYLLVQADKPRYKNYYLYIFIFGTKCVGSDSYCKIGGYPNFSFNLLYNDELFHCYILNETICHFRDIRSILSFFYFIFDGKENELLPREQRLFFMSKTHFRSPYILRKQIGSHKSCFPL